MLSISGRFLPPQEEEEEDPAAEWEQDVDAVCRSIRPTMPRRTAPAGGRFDHPCTDGVKILEIEEEEEEEKLSGEEGRRQRTGERRVLSFGFYGGRWVCLCRSD